MKEELGYLSDEQVIVIIPTMIIIMVVVLFFKIIIYQRRLELAHQRKREFMKLEQERKRIANDLHDYVASKLVVIKQNIHESFTRINDPDVLRSLKTSIDEIGHFHDDLRYQVEYIYPKELMVNNLKGSFEKLAEEMSTRDTKVIADVEFSTPLNEIKIHQLFRIAQETTSNIIAHINPRNVSISLSEDRSQKTGELTFTYDYSGDVTKKTANRLLGKGGRGKFVIEERMKILKARMDWYREDELFQQIFKFPLKN